MYIQERVIHKMLNVQEKNLGEAIMQIKNYFYRYFMEASWICLDNAKSRISKVFSSRLSWYIYILYRLMNLLLINKMCPVVQIFII